MKSKAPKPIPLAYIITWRTYATWLHGDKRTSVDRYHNKFLSPKIKPNAFLNNAMQKTCKHTSFEMNADQRNIVLQSIIQTCKFSRFHLYAAHVRSNHIHVVLSAHKDPDRVAVSLKAYATRHLKEKYPRERYWAKGQSTGYLFREIELFRATQYTIRPLA